MLAACPLNCRWQKFSQRWNINTNTGFLFQNSPLPNSPVFAFLPALNFCECETLYGVLHSLTMCVWVLGVEWKKIWELGRVILKGHHSSKISESLFPLHSYDQECFFNWLAEVGGAKRHRSIRLPNRFNLTSTSHFYFFLFLTSKNVLLLMKNFENIVNKPTDTQKQTDSTKTYQQNLLALFPSPSPINVSYSPTWEKSPDLPFFIFEISHKVIATSSFRFYYAL